MCLPQGQQCSDACEAIEVISAIILFSKCLYMYVVKACIFRAKLSFLCIICSLVKVKLSLDKYL